MGNWGMKKVNRKILSLVLIIIGAVNLVGCQLAKEDSGYENTENLRGTFITYNLEGEDYIDYPDKKYYGNFDSNLLEKHMDKYDFGGLDGYALFFHEEGEGEDKIGGAVADNIFGDMDVSININSDDGGSTNEEKIINATIYVTSKFKGNVQFNPIIKEGQKYYTTLGGSSIHVDGKDGVGSSISESSHSTIENTMGKSTSNKFSYTITVDVVDELKSIRLKEMSDDTLINAKEIIHKDKDYEFKIGKETSYVIIEEICIDEAGNEITKRTIYDKDDIDSEEGINHICNYSDDDGIVIPKYLYINK